MRGSAFGEVIKLLVMYSGSSTTTLGVVAKTCVSSVHLRAYGKITSSSKCYLICEICGC